MKIYMAGKVPKGDEELKGFDNWRARYQQVLSKLFKAEFIDPYKSEVDESDPLHVVGTDLNSIKESAFVVVNAEEKLGAGTSQEMVVAKYFKKPVVTVLPQDSHHRRSNLVFNGKTVEDWIHLFIHTFSDFIITDISKIETIKDNILTAKAKDISVVDRAIAYAASKSKHH